MGKRAGREACRQRLDISDHPKGSGSDKGHRGNEPNAEPERDAGQFLVLFSQQLHLEIVRTLKQNVMRQNVRMRS
jgi:hypothetical protein